MKARMTQHIYLGDEVVDAVDEEVERRETTCQETAPPPVVILKLNTKLIQWGHLLTAIQMVLYSVYIADNLISCYSDHHLNSGPLFESILK